MATIDSFRSTLTGGGARASQFRVNLTVPQFAGSPASTTVANDAVFLVKAASLPASTIMPIEVPFRGRMAKIAGERVFANWTVTVINDTNFRIRNALENWSRNILDNESTFGLTKPIAYTAQLGVQQLDRDDKVLKTYKFFNCYPQNIGEISLDFGNTNQVEEYQVEFSVDYWTSV